MEKLLVFESNLKCMGCVAQLQQAFNKTDGIVSFEADLQHPEKQLFIRTNLNESFIETLIQDIGFEVTLKKSTTI